MDDSKARELLSYAIDDLDPRENKLYCCGAYLCWPAAGSDYKEVELDGNFTADDLEALAWWMRNKERDGY